MSDGDKVLAWIRDWLVGGGTILMIADYDGTLSPHVGEPSQAWLEPGVRDHLRSLSTCARVRLSIISGRDLVDLRARVGVPDAIYAGCHGLEVDGPDMAFSHPEAEAQQDSLRMVGLALNQRRASVEGMRVEAKRLGLAIHYRDVPAERLREVEVALARAIQKSGHRLKVFHGARVIEILPQVGWNKGRCALWIREAVQRQSQRPVMTLYMGDDWTDEHAFEALEGQALTIKVGGGVPTSRARYRLPDVEAAQKLVADLAALVPASGAA